MVKREVIDSKILGAQALERQLAIWRFKSKRIVFTNGCFDIIHLGHIDYLSKAADLGEVLIVGLNSDASVRRIKGPNRPLNDQIGRATVLASLYFVDAVVLFDEDTPYQLIQTVQPDILVKGGDYRLTDIVGYDVVKAKGGEVFLIDFLHGYSSSSLLEKIKFI
ncbi:MAG: D-glycero-beta-D-manno-heptose 1-phosphate adenylyltransferase [Bacteroidetes bacterium]|nr:D-glycero-beta-D-manno-heptose 1-phosphate adenylyltransferase [Bacteroidota bacterium]